MLQISDFLLDFPSFFFGLVCQPLKRKSVYLFNKTSMRTLLLFVLLIHSSFSYRSVTGASADDVAGVWLNASAKGKVQIYRENGKYFGKIVWLREPLNEKGLPKRDAMNPSAALKSQPLVGLVILRELVFKDGEWTDGRIYDPENGKEYKCYLRMKDPNTLLLRGYIGISLMGRTEVWTRTQL
jgi:uncharacterized protein (DUF2147 family)